MSETATLRVVSAGLCTLVVDGGRPRWRGLGIPPGGAADRWSLALGNALVGNAPSTPALEIALAGPTLETDAPLACVLYGAPFALWTDRRDLRPGRTFTLEPGERLTIGPCREGMRAYLCVAGGIQAPDILGSRSSLQALERDQLLPCRPGRIATRFLIEPPEGSFARGPLRVLPGTHAGLFDQQRFLNQGWTVGPASNRMGVRLSGSALQVPAMELLSEPVCPGTVQVTRDGQCVVLGVDGQTIGGYPRLAQVIDADLDRVGQLRPGDVVFFEFVTLPEADALRRGRAETLRAWTARLLPLAEVQPG